MKLPKPIFQFLNWFPHQGFAFVACLVFVIGLLVGRAMVSIGMMLLIGNAIINLGVRDTFQSFWRDRSSLILVGIFLLYGVTFFWSANQAYYASRMQLMLPFLALPIVMHSIQWNKRWFEYILMAFIGVCVLGSVWSLSQYWQHMDAFNEAYGASKSIPTPFMNDHIRFGVTVVVGISFCLQFIKDKIYPLVFAVLSFFLIAYLHILASKTALLALYIIVLYEIVILIVSRKKIKLGLSILFVLLITPVLFFHTSDTFKNKLYYTEYAFYEMLNDNSQTNVSDEGRVVSYRTSWDVIKKNVLVGVGAGDGFDEMKKAYQDQGISTEKVLYPHNQFLYVALISGTIGLLLFLFFCIVLIKENWKKSSWLSSFILIFLIPLLVEAFFNTQYGVAIFVFFFMLVRRKYLLSKD